ncbi:hypothetical protein CDD82_2582 [Ophiocordyceps australis]|uniref:Uncharacterized protein n=1 Tax=Ophiocordyceps australis TaxID=1399860 RepID=A0A2C5XVA6_9HYPO|nr:hypothetical protein CDD82_2582 [Ophiocordyceps australis]
MAHIISCMAQLDPSASKPSSPVPSPTGLSRQASPSRAPQEKGYAWRMLQPEQHRKYQLLPKDKPTGSNNKCLDPEKAYALAIGQGGGEKADKSAYNVRARLNQISQPRRRKASVAEVGHMTTVQEAPMDSPTIPGRPPFAHERSSSAPSDDLDSRVSTASSAERSLFNFDEAFVKAIDDSFSEISQLSVRQRAAVARRVSVGAS